METSLRLQSYVENLFLQCAMMSVEYFLPPNLRLVEGISRFFKANIAPLYINRESRPAC